MRCKKFKAASREEEGYPHRSSTDRATRQQHRSVRLGRGYYDAIDWLFAPTFYSPSPLKSGKAGTLTRSRRKSHDCALAAMEFRLKGES